MIRKIFLLFISFSIIVSSSLYGDEYGQIEIIGATSVDFGKYPAWKKKTARYKIKNTGKADLKIIKIRKTCGCASALIDKNILKPGETGIVEVVILPNSIYKLFSKNIFVENSDPDNSFFKLNVTGNAVPLIDIMPKADIYTGRIKTNTYWSSSFILKGNNIQLGKPIVDSNYDLNINLIKINICQYTLTANLSPADQSGDLKCLITIPVKQPLPKINGIETNPSPVKISISGRIGYELNVVPGIARIPFSDQPVTRLFIFNVMGQRSRVLESKEIKLPDRDDIGFIVSQEHGGRYIKIKAIFKPEFIKKLYTGETITLEFSVLGASSAKILCKIKK